MEPRSWSLRLALALAVATALWVGAAQLTDRVVAGHAARMSGEASARAAVSPGSHATTAR